MPKKRILFNKWWNIINKKLKKQLYENLKHNIFKLKVRIKKNTQRNVQSSAWKTHGERLEKLIFNLKKYVFFLFFFWFVERTISEQMKTHKVISHITNNRTKLNHTEKKKDTHTHTKFMKSILVLHKYG